MSHKLIALVATSLLIVSVVVMSGGVFGYEGRPVHEVAYIEFQTLVREYDTNALPALMRTEGKVDGKPLKTVTDDIPTNIADANFASKGSTYLSGMVPVAALAQLPPVDAVEEMPALSFEITLLVQGKSVVLTTAQPTPLWRFDNVSVQCSRESAQKCANGQLCCTAADMEQYCKTLLGSPVTPTQYFRTATQETCAVGDACGICQRASILTRACVAIEWSPTTLWTSSTRNCEFRNTYATGRSTHTGPVSLSTASCEIEIRANSDPLIAWHVASNEQLEALKVPHSEHFTTAFDFPGANLGLELIALLLLIAVVAFRCYLWKRKTIAVVKEVPHHVLIAPN